jgi:hypothetical protein
MSNETKKPKQGPKVKPLKRRSAAPDDPIYTRGFVLGRIGRPLRPAPVELPVKANREDKTDE